jgi:negative regulator of flagellin synthesis FlgM
MKIENKAASYEINRHLTKYSQNVGENAQLREGRMSNEIRKGDGDAIVNISSASKEFKLAVDAVNSAPDVREDKIAEIRDKIESGRYQIDHRTVAGRVLDDFMNGIL